MTRLRDSFEAAETLLQSLPDSIRREDLLVLALPRGGVPIGHHLAEALHAQFDVITVRKVGHPNYPELALGALAWGGGLVINRSVITNTSVRAADITEALTRQTKELVRLERLYRGTRAFPEVEGRTVLVVDDGVATGATMLAAARAVQQHNPARLLIMAPIAPREAACRLARAGVECIIPHVTPYLRAIASYYESFEAIVDSDVRDLLRGVTEGPLSTRYHTMEDLRTQANL